MKGRVIKEVNLGDFNVKEGAALYGYKISFKANSEWELEFVQDLPNSPQMVRCKNGVALVLLSWEMATEIFGEWIKSIKEIGEKSGNDNIQS